MRCTNCGAELKPGALFCTNCGAKAASQQQPQQQSGFAAAPRPGKSAGKTCPVCGKTVPAGYVFCTACGASLSAPEPANDRTAVCWKCGAAIRPDLRFCTNCGADQQGDAAYETPAPRAKKRNTGLWITLICLLLAAIAAVAVLYFTGALDDMLGIDREQSDRYDDEDEEDEEDSDSDKKDETASEDEDKADEEEADEEEQEEEPAASEEPEPEYLIPDSSSRYLTDADLEGLSWRELCLARNEIFARHGRIFKTPEIAAYFEGKDWYDGRYAEVTLSAMETANVNLIIAYENAHFGGSYY